LKEIGGVTARGLDLAVRLYLDLIPKPRPLRTAFDEIVRRLNRFQCLMGDGFGFPQSPIASILGGDWEISAICALLRASSLAKNFSNASFFKLRTRPKDPTS